MSIDELKAVAETVLATTLKDLLEDGEVQPFFFLVRTDGTREIWAIDGPMMNSAKHKAELSRRVHALADAGELEAVIFVSDTYVGKTTLEKQKIIDALKLNVEQAHARGLCSKEEAVMVTLESPIYQQLTQQQYRRDPPDGSKATLTERHTASGKEAQFSGQFLNFFEKQKASRA